jgi:hypothetical protein
VITTKRRRRKKQWASWSDEQRAAAIVTAMTPLLELFAVCDDVFSEDDALTTPAMMRTTVGRVYEQYKKARAELDPGWTGHERPRRPMTRRVGDRRARSRAVQRDLG